MTALEVVSDINASAQRCFDLARDLDTHVQSAGRTGERIVGPRKHGLLEINDTVTFEARHLGVRHLGVRHLGVRHLGIRQRLTAQITAMDAPHFFQDRMTQGVFKHFEHDHLFDPQPDGSTQMTDRVRFAAPGGPLGFLVERLVLKPHLIRFLKRRGQYLKALAEVAPPKASS